MEIQQLSGDQVEALYDRLHPKADYLARLEMRMFNQGFTDGERLLMHVRCLQVALQALLLEVHSLSCDGAGRPSK